MDRKIRRQTKVKAYTPKLDVEEFQALTDLLFETLKESNAACARILGISRVTWKRWEKEPPTWPWWNLVLRHIIKTYLTTLRTKGGLTRKHRQRIMDALSRIPQQEAFEAEIDTLAYQLTGAEFHLRQVLLKGGRWWDEIRLPANNGGYNEKTLLRAARRLMVVKTQEGFGKRKRSYWRLPDQDDD